MEIIKLDFPAKLLYHYEKQKDFIFLRFFVYISRYISKLEQYCKVYATTYVLICLIKTKKKIFIKLKSNVMMMNSKNLSLAFKENINSQGMLKIANYLKELGKKSMKYFLTSNPLLAKEQILNPSNEFVNNLQKDIPERANALFICSDPNSYDLTDKFAEEMKTCFFNSGFKFKNFKVLDNRNAKEKSELISEAEVVILAGGHVSTQNIFFQQINLKNELKTSNKIIIGFSAGSMNCSEEVYAQPELQGESLDPNYKRFLKGLGITKSQILPHYNLIKNEYLDGKRLFEEITYPDSFGRAFITLNDRCYLYGDGQYEIVYGESFIISDGTIKK